MNKTQEISGFDSLTIFILFKGYLDFISLCVDKLLFQQIKFIKLENEISGGLIFKDQLIDNCLTDRINF